MPTSQHFGPIVEGGGGSGFSDDCKAALEACGMDPDSFGDYAHVSRQIDAAKQAVADWQIARNTGSLATATPPTAQQRFLANCESGHIMQNATAQGPPPQTTNPPGVAVTDARGRANYCRNVIPGYDPDRAPAMPMHDGADGRSGHGIATGMEQSQVAGRTPGSPYPTPERQAHQEARVRAALQDHVGRMNRAEQTAARDRATQARAAAGTGATGAPGTAGGGAGGATAAGATQPKRFNPSSEQLDLAAECVAAMASWAEANMQATCAASAAANAQRAASPEHQAEIARLRNEAQASSQRYREARNRLMSGTNPDGTPMTRAQQIAAQREMIGAQREMLTARDSVTRAESLACYGAQGNQINNGNLGVGRIPGAAPTPAAGGSSGTGATSA